MRYPLALASLTAGLVLASAGRPDPAPTQDEDEVRSLAAEVRDAVRELDALRGQEADERAAELRERSDLEAQIARLEQSAAESRRHVVEAEAEVAALEEEARAIEQRSADLGARARAWVETVKPFAERMRERLDGGIRWRQEERARRLQALLDLLRHEDLRQQLEAVGQVPLWCAEELNAARRVDVSNEPVLLEEGTRLLQAWRIRVGLVQDAFVVEAGPEVGLSSKGEWNREPDAASEAAVRLALDVLQEREAPQVIAFPLPASRAVER